MLSIIYPYRNRDLKRIRFSLQSLESQSSKAFQVYFVDYGSPTSHAEEVKEVLKEYSFVTYSYEYTEHQPWNKSKVLNSVVKGLKSEYFFVADIDMIFSSNFIEKAIQLSKTNEVWYFQVGFLDNEGSKSYKAFEEYNIKFKSEKDATGLTLCPTQTAKKINGFDEFYHFWGSEDTDFHARLKHAGFKVNFYDESILMVHQWHKSYRSKEVVKLSKSIQLSGIVQFNHGYLNKTIENKTTIVNNTWGEIQSENDFKALENISENGIVSIGLSSIEIDYFLFQTLPNLVGQKTFVFKAKPPKKQTFKKIIKSIIGNKKVITYTLKEVNDKLLFHIINFYHTQSYNYRISDDLDAINFSIIKRV